MSEETINKETKSKKEPKVVMFGSEVNSDNYEGWGKVRHHRRHGSFTWGLFFILVGVLFLLSNFGALPPVVWSQIAHLWPIVIIFIGIDTMLGHSEFSEIISSLIGLLIFATILGVILINVSPNLVSGLPAGVLNYFYAISSYLRLK
jgi:hypothetical protein